MAGAAAAATDHPAECRVTVPAADVVAGEEHENVKAAGRRRACCVPAARLFSWMAATRDWALGVAMAAWLWLASCAAAARDGVAGFGRTVWKVGADDPRKAVHGLKVALALTLCSVFYYVRPLYSFTGESAMWAVLTVVVVFEYTVGGCFYKGINRAMATITGGALALGVQWVASKSGKEFEPYILTGSLFIFAAAATYSRFIPTMKARFDYGVTIFILTYTLVAVSGYRVDELVALAQNRLTTIAIGAAICFAVCALVLPVWAGQELHDQVARNMDKLADAVEACVHDYFSSDERRVLSARASGYKAVLNAKASEDSLANLATWEPAHGDFGFRHPYPMYQKVGAAMRRCAYSVDALAASVTAEIQAPARVKKSMSAACAALSRTCAAVLREASGSLDSMTRSGRLALLVDDMNAAAADLREELRRLAVALEDDDEPAEPHEQSTAPPLIEVLPLFTATSLLLEICARAEGVVGAVDALATAAKFKKADHEVVDVEAATVPVTTSSTATLAAADAPQETHAKVAVDKEKTTATEQAPRDQVGELIKVLMRRRSTKKKRAPKVCPQPPLDFAAHAAPSPKSWSMELTTSRAQVVPSPKSWSMDLAAHPPVAPSPRHRSVDVVAGHPPVAPSPRHRAVVELAAGHPPIAPSPRHRAAVDVAGHGPVVLTSPRNRSLDFANLGPVAPSPRHRSILAMA